MLRLTLDRPAAIAGVDEAELLDPGYSPDGDWPGAPALGLGFALRLVRNLAEAVGGALVVGRRRGFALDLPALGAGRARRPTASARPEVAAIAVEHAPCHLPRGACSSTVEPAAHNG